MPTQALFLRFHQWVYETTGGRLGHRMIGVPCLLLFTTGRKSGQERTSALVYAKDGDSYVVVGSNGGADRPPGWMFNLGADREVEVQVGTDRSPATATVVEPGHGHYERLWLLVNENNHGRYDGYQSKTDRPIPLVVLTRSPTRPN